jgi:hypothetical protein
MVNAIEPAGGVFMQYLIVEASSAMELQEKVQYYIDRGWKPQGGLSVAAQGIGNWWYYQAMVMPDEV